MDNQIQSLFAIYDIFIGIGMIKIAYDTIPVLSLGLVYKYPTQKCIYTKFQYSIPMLFMCYYGSDLFAKGIINLFVL